MCIDNPPEATFTATEEDSGSFDIPATATSGRHGHTTTAD
jgi:hypothetical protein